MDNGQLAKEYRKSLQLITGRINMLKIRLKELEGNRHSSEEELTELKMRLKPLLAMQRDLREVAREVQNYYEPGWWRSENYTFNRRKPRRFIPYFRNVFEEDIIYQLEPDTGDEEGFV